VNLNCLSGYLLTQNAQIINTPPDPSNFSGSSKDYDGTAGTRRISIANQQRPRDFGLDDHVTLESDHDQLNSSPDNQRPSQFSHDMNDLSSTSSVLPSNYTMMGSISYYSPEVSVTSVYTDPESHLEHRIPTLSSLTASGTNPGISVIDPTLRSTHDAGRAELFHSNGDTFPELAATDLEALDYLISTPTTFDLFLSGAQDEKTPRVSDHSVQAVPLEPQMIESPDTYATYYPDPTYKELHSVLHNHMIETARASVLTRQGTPEPAAQDSMTSSKYPTPSALPERAEDSTPMVKPVHKVTSRRELELWQNYLEEVAVWLDMFDVDRNFQLKIPMMAKTADHLHYSVLSLSARQMERTHADKPYTESLTLYQKAIEFIVRDLHTLDTSVIASCVLLCVLEMMSSSPRAWSRHLDGCAMLLQAAGINGTVGGVRQALFWCFARMDVWGGFLSDTRTKIPTSRWFMPSGSMSSAVSRFKAGSVGSDSYANYAVFLCASVVNVLSNRASTRTSENSSDLNHSFSARWKALFDLLEDWYNCRPEEMQPLMACPTTLEDHQHPFPIILYGTSPAINGNQLYHASSLLMLQEKPKDVRLGKSHKSIHWHARQICGIATSNRIHGPWINALQPLWIAGKVMSHPIEHRIILETLACIEKQTGWATSWRAEDLKEYWGETDDCVL